MNILSPFTREFWVHDEDVRAAVGPLPARDRIQQAHLSAIALESDREQLRIDLMRRRRELREDLARVEAGLDELDALRILETAT